MFWIVVAILIAGYMISRAIRAKSSDAVNTTVNDDSPIEKVVYSQRELERLRAMGNKYYETALVEAKKDIATREADLKNPKVFLSQEMREESVKNAYLHLQTLEKLKDYFIRLEEKYKHNTIQEKYFIYQDWVDYGYIQHMIQSKGKQLDFADNEYADKLFEAIKEYHMRCSEIMKRFEASLA
jgi:hypothetical protein